jgi:hypothetical protein
VRVTALDVRGSDSDGTTVGATFTGVGDHYETKDVLTWRAAYAWGLGGGTGGVEGGLGLHLAGGFRAPFGDEHGPLVRVGGGGEFWGNDRFYFSRLELPSGEAGYQYLSGSTLFEITGRVAPILGGRYNVGDGARRETSSGYEWGASAVVHTSFGRLDLTYSRLETPTRTLDTPIDVLRGDVCGYIGHFGICGNAHFIRGDVDLPTHTVSRATTLYGGVTLGYATW